MDILADGRVKTMCVSERIAMVDGIIRGRLSGWVLFGEIRSEDSVRNFGPGKGRSRMRLPSVRDNGI